MAFGLVLNFLLNSFFNFVKHCLEGFSFCLLVSLKLRDLVVTIGRKAAILLGFPYPYELLHCLKDETFLFHRELSVLSESVKHHDILLLDTCEWAALNFFPNSLFFIKRVTCIERLFFARIEAIIILVFFLVLRVEPLLDLYHVRHCLLQSLIEKAAVIAERNRHVRA